MVCSLGVDDVSSRQLHYQGAENLFLERANRHGSSSRTMNSSVQRCASASAIVGTLGSCTLSVSLQFVNLDS